MRPVFFFLCTRYIQPQGILPTPRHGCVLASHCGRLVLHGGYGGSTAQEHRFLNDIRIFDTQREEWNEARGGRLLSMISVLSDGDGGAGGCLEDTTMRPSPRRHHSASVAGDHLIVFGGWDGQKDLNDVWIFDLTTLLWEKCTIETEKPCPRSQHKQFTLSDNRVLVYGGGHCPTNPHSVAHAPPLPPVSLVGDIWILDISLRSWTHVGHPKLGLSVIQPLYPVMSNGRLIVFDSCGAYRTEWVDNVVDDGVVKERKWVSSRNSWTSGRTEYSICAGFNEILVFGGRAADGNVMYSAVYALTIE